MGQFLRMLIAGHEREFVGLCSAGQEDEGLSLVSEGTSFYPVWEQLIAPRLVRTRGLKTFIAPYNTAPLRLDEGVRLIVVIHDLIFLEASERSVSSYQNLGKLYRRWVVPKAIARAQHIITVSDFTARALAAQGVSPSRITIIPNALGPDWFAPFPARDSHRTSVLLVSGEAPSKNLSRAIEALGLCLRRLHEPELRVEIAGVKPRFHRCFQAIAERSGIGSRTEFFEYVPASRMRELYRRARLLVLPSLREGFGIPLLEAMASATPVVASSGTCLPEVGGGAARYFDPYSVANMAVVIQSILSDPTAMEAMIAAGLSRARLFRQDDIAKRVALFWDSVL